MTKHLFWTVTAALTAMVGAWLFAICVGIERPTPVQFGMIAVLGIAVHFQPRIKMVGRLLGR
jgi:hypothetical protein